MLGVVDRLDRRAAARARLALAPVDLQRHRQLVGDLRRRSPPRSGRSRRRARGARRAARSTSVARRGRSPCLNGDSRASQRISSTQERPMPAITRWSRSSGCRWRGWSSALARAPRAAAPARPRGRASRPSRRPSTLAGRQQLRPGPLLGPELAQPQLAAVGEPDQHPRGAVLERGALVEHLQAARPTSGGRGSCQRSSLAPADELDDRHLADPAHARDRAARRARSAAGRALQRDHPRRERRLDLGARRAPRSRRRAVISTSGSSGIGQA